MKFEMSEESSKRILSGTKWIVNVSQNYLASLNTTSSGKKLINAFLLIPIIVPTAITVSLIGCTYFFLDAASTQENDSKLSKVAKGVARALIYIVAAVTLIPCVILNLAISLIPSLIFWAINKDMFSQKNAGIESNQGQTVKEVKIDNDEDYNKRLEKEADKLGQQDDVGQDQSSTDLHRSLISSQLHNQPIVEVISREVDDKQAVDQTVIVKNINNNNIRDGEMMMRAVEDDRSFTACGIVTGNVTNKQKGFAVGFGLQCELLENKKGLDLQLGFSVRTGANKQEATQALMQSESARTILSPGNGGILSIEQHSNTVQNRT